MRPDRIETGGKSTVRDFIISVLIGIFIFVAVYGGWVLFGFN